MQSLVFEQAWEKTIDPYDRQKIEATFMQASQLEEGDRQKFIPLWQARNHRGDLLVAVIVQNFGGVALTLENVALTYCEGGQPVAAHIFSHPGLTIASKCSMPWTFIFPKSKIIKEPCFDNGYVREDK